VTDQITATKHAMPVRVSSEDVDDGATIRGALIDALSGKPPTPEQTARWVEHRMREIARLDGLKATHATVLAATTGVLAKIAALHAPNDNGQCTGCEYSGMEAEPPDWPCDTAALIAKDAGISLTVGVI
jgi:hypothetical protein